MSVPSSGTPQDPQTGRSWGIGGVVNGISNVHAAYFSRICVRRIPYLVDICSWPHATLGDPSMTTVIVIGTTILGIAGAISIAAGKCDRG